jgi:hypothetical protein
MGTEGSALLLQSVLPLSRSSVRCRHGLLEPPPVVEVVGEEMMRRKREGASEMKMHMRRYEDAKITVCKKRS